MDNKRVLFSVLVFISSYIAYLLLSAWFRITSLQNIKIVELIALLFAHFLVLLVWLSVALVTMKLLNRLSVQEFSFSLKSSEKLIFVYLAICGCMMLASLWLAKLSAVVALGLNMYALYSFVFVAVLFYSIPKNKFYKDILLIGVLIGEVVVEIHFFAKESYGILL